MSKRIRKGDEVFVLHDGEPTRALVHRGGTETVEVHYVGRVKSGWVKVKRIVPLDAIWKPSAKVVVDSYQNKDTDR